MAQIVIENIRKEFGDFTAVNNVSFHIASNEIVGLLGHNGAGKTTFFNTLFGFIKKRSGSIEINANIDPREQIAYLETEPYFYPLLTGREYLNIFKI